MALAEAFGLDGFVRERDGHRILDGVSDQIHRACTTAVLGASRSGKSTFLRMLDRFPEPTDGTIRVDGQPLASYDVHALRRRVGLVAQHPTMLTPTVGEDVRLARPDLDDAGARLLLERVALPSIGLEGGGSASAGWW